MKQQENKKLHKKNRLQSGFVRDNLVRKPYVVPDQTREEQLRREQERRKRWEAAARKKAVKQEIKASYARANGMTYYEMAAVAAMVCLVLVACLWIVYEEAQTAAVVRKVNALKKEYSAVLAENDALENNINNSIQVNEIYEYVTQTLGMDYIRKDQIITYEKREKNLIHQGESIPGN